MLSIRYAIPTIILLALALIPTSIHSYIQATIDDGKSIHAISTSLNNFISTPSKRNAQFGMDIFGTEDWFERIYQSDQHTQAKLFVARSYDHKRLYHHPELALSYAQSLPIKETLDLPDNISIKILRKEDNSILVAYALLYEDQIVKNPIKHQLSESTRLLFNARKAITLLYVSQKNFTANINPEKSAAVSLLTLAIKSFQVQHKQ